MPPCFKCMDPNVTCDHSDARWRHGNIKDFSPADFDKLKAQKLKQQQQQQRQAQQGDAAAASEADVAPAAKVAPKKRGGKKVAPAPAAEAGGAVDH